MFGLDVAVYVAKPVDVVCSDHLDVPKSPICRIRLCDNLVEPGATAKQGAVYACFYIGSSVCLPVDGLKARA